MLEPSRAEVRALLPRGFVRLSQSDAFLFVSDAPRRLEADALAECLGALRLRGYECAADESGLLWLDWGRERWDAFISACPSALPALPKDCYEAYSLCRLLMRHAAPSDDFACLRGVLKRWNDAPAMERFAREQRELCACRLRLSQPLPACAGRALARWLMEKEERS